jgi:RIO kinase 1
VPEIHRKRSFAEDGSLTFEQTVRVPKPRWDDDDPDPDQTTYTDSTHGPQPAPSWVITSDAARQYDLGVLKTGKEADVYLVERLHGDDRNVLAAKRYRALRDRLFRDDSQYRQARRTGDRRFDLAVAKGTDRGMAFRARQWLETEFRTLERLWQAGLSVPYPVQMLGSEVMTELVLDEAGEPAPRLVAAASGLSRAGLGDLHEQATHLLYEMVGLGVVHGDLSPFNVLVGAGCRLWAIDFPQAVHPLDPSGLDLLQRDVTNLIGWFAQKGVQGIDPDAMFGQLAALALSS